MQVRIAIGGDIIFGKGVSQIARARGLGYFLSRLPPCCAKPTGRC
jgi:hypothetical protein